MSDVLCCQMRVRSYHIKHCTYLLLTKDCNPSTVFTFFDSNSGGEFKEAGALFRVKIMSVSLSLTRFLDPGSVGFDGSEVTFSSNPDSDILQYALFCRSACAHDQIIRSEYCIREFYSQDKRSQ